MSICVCLLLIVLYWRDDATRGCVTKIHPRYWIWSNRRSISIRGETLKAAYRQVVIQDWILLYANSSVPEFPATAIDNIWLVVVSTMSNRKTSIYNLKKWADGDVSWRRLLCCHVSNNFVKGFWISLVLWRSFFHRNIKQLWFLSNTDTTWSFYDFLVSENLLIVPHLTIVKFS